MAQANNGSGFRLQRLLDLREREVEAQRDHLYACQRALTEWQAARQQLVARRSEAGLTPGAYTDGGRGAALHLDEQGRRWFARELARLEAGIEEQERAVNAAQDGLWQAEQRRRRIDRLRERFEAQQGRLAKRAERKRANRWVQTRQGAGR